MKRIVFSTLILSLLFTGCGGSKKTIAKTPSKTDIHNKSNTTKPADDKAEQTSNTGRSLDVEIVKYIAKFRKIAKKEMKEYGIPSSITLAQGILESQSGKSDLAVKGNNHFGIKCHKDWNGKTIHHDDDSAQECFRKYTNPEDSYKDHSRFLAHRKRYAFMFRLPKTDYEAWARGLKNAGYATDPSYADKLIYIIEKYGLSKLDTEVLENMSVKVDKSAGNVQGNKKKKFIYEVKSGETLFTISHKFDIPVKDIQRINNLNDFDIYEGQILVLTAGTNQEETGNKTPPAQTETPPVETVETIEKAETVETTDTKAEKNTKPETTDNKTFQLHEVKQGETLFSIAKEYNIDIADLREANQLPNNEINVGDSLKIPEDKIKPVLQEVVETTPVDNDKAYHVVKPGETLYRIHVNYNVSISKLRKLNHLKGNYIKVGQKLRIK